jgi:hypothetical protein
MTNKKTTIIGILLLIGAISTGAGELLGGTGDLSDIVGEIMAALTGAGLLAARDGGL